MVRAGDDEQRRKYNEPFIHDEYKLRLLQDILKKSRYLKEIKKAPACFQKQYRGLTLLTRIKA